MASRKDLYLAVDVGGTKILAAVVNAAGMVVNREKCATPREPGAAPLCAALEALVAQLVEGTPGLSLRELSAMGIGVPGVVDPDEGLVVVTPNMGLSDTRLGDICRKMFGLPVALGNDCNIGTLGEHWLGSARGAESVMGILVGTGIGGGFVQGSRVWAGARNMASEIGHIVMEIDGPRCGCGNRGCLEALASRTAIERDLRAAVAAGRSTVLSEWLGGNLEQIRSSVLRQALAAGDALATEVLRHAAEVIGHACLTVGHLLDPEMIVLGGGVVEACSDFMLPVVEAVVADDSLAAGHAPARIRVSSLGDDAVLLGATALARMRVGENPLKKHFHVDPAYPPIVRRRSAACDVGDKSFDADFYISASGKAKRQKAPPLAAGPDGTRQLTREHLARPCRDGPHVLFISTGPADDIRLTEDAGVYMRQRGIKWRALPLDEAIEAYNGSRKRKGALIHVS